MSTVTCRTEGCGNADIPLEMDLRILDVAGQPTGEMIENVICGACGEPITDIAHDTATPQDGADNG